MNADVRNAPIIITMDSAHVESSDLDTLVRLAERMNTGLEAVFIEDSDLLRLQSFAFLHEFRPSSMRVDPLEGGRLQQELRAIADRARRNVADFARQRGLDVPFRVWRGSVSRELLGALPAEVLALMRVGAVNTLPVRRRRHATLAVLFDGSEAAARALRVAANLAAEQGDGALNVLLPAGDPASIRALRKKALDDLADTALPRIEFHVLADAASASLNFMLEHLGSSALVVARDSIVLAPRTIRTHLAAASCATLLVR